MQRANFLEDENQALIKQIRSLNMEINRQMGINRAIRVSQSKALVLKETVADVSPVEHLLLKNEH